MAISNTWQQFSNHRLFTWFIITNSTLNKFQLIWSFRVLMKIILQNILWYCVDQKEHLHVLPNNFDCSCLLTKFVHDLVVVKQYFVNNQKKKKHNVKNIILFSLRIRIEVNDKCWEKKWWINLKKYHTLMLLPFKAIKVQIELWQSTGNIAKDVQKKKRRSE